MTFQEVLYPDLQNKKILVTGALRGIGFGIVNALIKQKAHVIFNYREGQETKALELKQKWDLEGIQTTPLCFDLNETEKMQSVIRGFIEKHGPIEGLVNNAGISKDQIVLRINESDLSKILDTNLKGTILLTVALTRGFLKAKNVSVVNIGSVVGLMGNASQIAYSASKAGLIGFGKSFAKEVSSRNIRCNTICPGFIETDMTKELSEKVRDTYLSQIPLKRFGTPEEVAQLTCFLLSQASSYITGNTIKIDGGLYI